ncbi:flippase [Dehalococcoidia bacterium]|nr:flippase [Dehalococcoidia bacterium]
MQPSRKFAFDVGITFLASVVSLSLGFVVTILLGRYLGADDLGLFRMTSTIYGIAMLVAAIGIPATMIKYVAEFKKNKTKSNQIVSSGVITSLLLGIGFIALFYFSSGIFAEIFKMPRLSGLIRLLSPVFPFALVGGALLGLLNGIREMKKCAAATIIHSVLMVIVTVVLIYYGFGVTGAVIGIVLSSVGSSAYLIFVSRRYFRITLVGYRQATGRLLKFGAQIFGANAINMINYKADIVLIGFFLTATDVGHYAVAVGLSTFFWLIPDAVQRITYPATSEYWSNNNHSALQKMIDKSMKYTACILLPIGLGVGFFARDIVTMIFGQGFVHAALPLQILIVGTVIFGVVKAIGGSVTGVGRPDIGLKVVGISATINVLLNVLLIPHFGIAGAAIATTTSLLVATLLGFFFTIRIVKVRIDFGWLGKLSGITLLSIFFFMGLGFINTHLVGAIILSVFVFIIAAFLLSKEDRAYFMELVGEARSFLKTLVQLK